MLELYRKLEHADPKQKNIILTVVEGEHLGQKALLRDGEIIWESDPDKNLASYQNLNQLKPGLSQLENNTIFSETIGGPKKMIICGAGHVGIQIAKIVLMVGFQVTVIEDRPTFADTARRAGVHQVICESFGPALDQIPGDLDTFFVIVTRGHRHDQSCLQRIALKPHAYMGMIGSRRRVALVKELLEEEGIPKEKLSDLHAPIGLDIGAQTPEEIAVAVLAEIIQIKNQSGRTGGIPEEILREILYPATPHPTPAASSSATPHPTLAAGSSSDLHSTPEAKPQESAQILATIIRRIGSAPREAGAKMLILADGRCIGTIGGGCAEAEVVRKALLKIRTDQKATEVIRVDLSQSTAEEEGMVCGGQMDVLLERIR